jgi:hypothetical protein
MSVTLRRVLIALALGVLLGPHAVADGPARVSGDPPPAPDGGSAQPARPAFASTSAGEQKTLKTLLAAPSWTKRAIAAVRLEAYGCDESASMLIGLLDDPAWQVRSFAIRSLARRRIGAEPSWFAEEDEPRVLREALRHRYPVDIERLGRGVRFLARSEQMEDKLLAAELGAASGDEALIELAREQAKKVILRMSRAEAGGLSPRIASLVGHYDLRKPYRWRTWLLQQGRGFEVRPVYAIDDGDMPTPPSLIGRLPPDDFGSLEQYMTKLGEREVDLAICLDCTASMSGELTAAQAGIDDLMLFVGDVVKQLRVGIVGYRDRRDRFETKGWGFTTSIDLARERLWQLSADGGGDERELVHRALRTAYTQLAWDQEHTKVLILIGDAPPHVGHGAECIEMARLAAESKLTTHVIQAEGEDVEHFPEIARAGGGRCVSLEDDDALIAEIAGLTLGERFEAEFREFFDIYLELCR